MTHQLRIGIEFEPVVSAGLESFALGAKTSSQSGALALRRGQVVSAGASSSLWSGWFEVGGELEVRRL